MICSFFCSVLGLWSVAVYLSKEENVHWNCAYVQPCRLSCRSIIWSNTNSTVTSYFVLVGDCEKPWNPTNMLLPSNTKLINTLSKSFPKWMQKLFDYRCCQIYKNERTNIETLSKKEPSMFLNVTGLEDFEPHSYSMLANALTFVKQEGECSEDKKNPCRLFIKVTQHNQQWYFLNITPYLKLKVVNVTTVNIAASVV